MRDIEGFVFHEVSTICRLVPLSNSAEYKDMYNTTDFFCSSHPLF